jgi:hypothetical protein
VELKNNLLKIKKEIKLRIIVFLQIIFIIPRYFFQSANLYTNKPSIKYTAIKNLAYRLKHGRNKKTKLKKIKNQTTTLLP